MSKRLQVIGITCQIGALCIYIAVHLLFTIFTSADEVRWFIPLNNMKQIVFLDTLFTIGIFLMFVGLIIFLSELAVTYD